MVDPNPGRGMPAQLRRYWIAGKGAAKIRWNSPGDFTRCVTNLRKHFPKEPEGLCAKLHHQATGMWPGDKDNPGMAITASATSGPGWLEAAALIASMPTLGKHLWAGPLAPIGRLTSEPRKKRVFEYGALKNRVLPLPLDWRKMTGQGHEGSVTVGRILGITYGPNEAGLDFAWGWGDMFDEEIIPEARAARYLVEKGVAGTSVDPGGAIAVTVDPLTGIEHMMDYTIGGATLVSIPAFDAMRIYSFDESGDWPDDDLDMVMDLEGDSEYSGDCGCSDTHTVAVGASSETFTVNSGGWKGLPLAPRDAVFDNDDAVKRIQAWAGVSAQGADVDKLRRAFLWHNPQLPETNTTSYRLPVGDIINGRLTMVFHAIYAAAALLSGAHGGLPDIPDQDKNDLRAVISAIYPEMATAFNDNSIRAPWDRSAQEGIQLAMSEFSTSEDGYPLTPPVAWFSDPKLAGKTPLAVTPEGRVFGHLAAWNECHRDVTMRECVMAPKSRQSYAPFHLGDVLTAEGETVKVGKIVMDTRHADIRLGYAAAALHYDNTGDEIAVVRAGEDEYGIWVAGAVVPEATPRKVAKLRRSPLSGDWRREKGSLELTAALAVNTPAFPVYTMENEERMALVAAGTVIPEFDDEADTSTGTWEPVTITGPPTGIDSLVASLVEDEVSRQEEELRRDRAQRLADIKEDEEILAQRDRARRLSSVFAMDPAAVVPAPAAPAAVPAPAAPGAPVPVAGEAPTGDDALIIEQNADARYSIVEEPEGGGENEDQETQAVAATPAPAAPVPAAGY